MVLGHVFREKSRKTVKNCRKLGKVLQGWNFTKIFWDEISPKFFIMKSFIFLKFFLDDISPNFFHEILPKFYPGVIWPKLFFDDISPFFIYFFANEISSGPFRVWGLFGCILSLGSLWAHFWSWVHFWSRGHFGPISGLGVTSGQFRVSQNHGKLQFDLRW